MEVFDSGSEHTSSLVTYYS